MGPHLRQVTGSASDPIESRREHLAAVGSRLPKGWSRNEGAGGGGVAARGSGASGAGGSSMRAGPSGNGRFDDGPWTWRSLLPPPTPPPPQPPPAAGCARDR